jgi:GrpB-like predicted nucleotidyltransferase (UPF0157 family)
VQVGLKDVIADELEQAHTTLEGLRWGEQAVCADAKGWGVLERELHEPVLLERLADIRGKVGRWRWRVQITVAAGAHNGGRPQSVRLRHMSSVERSSAAADDLARAGGRDAVVQIVDYDPAWPAAFEAERERLTPLLDGADIHHFGSTAVPGLAAKPVIDMIALVGDLDAPIAALVQRAGYEFPRAFNATLAHRRFLCYPTAAYRTHHLHLVDEREGLKRRLRFRDRLRTDRQLAREYVALKRTLAQRHRDDREAYTEAKSEFIDQHDWPTAPWHATHDPA